MSEQEVYSNPYDNGDEPRAGSPKSEYEEVK